MQPFTYEGEAIITSINLRGENHGEEKVPAYDISLEFRANDEICAYFDPVLRAWCYNEQGFVRNKAIRMPIKFNEELPRYALSIDGLELVDMTLSKFEVQPEDGRALLIACQARRIAHDNESAQLHRLLARPTQIKLEPQQGDLLDD